MRRRWATWVLASILLPCLAGCEKGAESGAALQQSVEPATPSRAALGDTPKTASRKTPDTLEPDVPIDTAQPETPDFVIEATRDLQSLDLKAIQVGKVVLPPLLLTVDISKVPLREVLAELGREIGAKVYVADTVPDEAISIKFEKLSVRDGIQRILQGRNYTLVYKKRPAVHNTQGQGISEELMVAEIRILSQDPKVTPEAAEFKEVTKAEQQAAKAQAFAKKALEAGTAKERLAALRKFLKRVEASQLTDILIPALKDENPKVRELALERIGDGHDVPLEPIADIAQSDESPKLRISALDRALSIHGPAAAIPIIQQALNDPDPKVREAAMKTLELAQLMEQQDLENQNQ